MSRTVQEWKSYLAVVAGDELSRALNECARDSRAGVRALAESARRQSARAEAERTRLAGLLTFENSLRAEGKSYIAGLDEVGRGALAGPVTVAAVILPPGVMIDCLDDSKRLDSATRRRVAVEVRRVAEAYSIVHVAAHVIDLLGIAGAIHRGMQRALDLLSPAADHALVDGLPLGLGLPETAVVKGDSKIAAIAAASVIAKVARDDVMRELAEPYSAWCFDVNKGYGTAEHLAMITTRGVTPVHRRSFAPCNQSATLF